MSGNIAARPSAQPASCQAARTDPVAATRNSFLSLTLIFVPAFDCCNARSYFTEAPPQPPVYLRAKHSRKSRSTTSSSRHGGDCSTLPTYSCSWRVSRRVSVMIDRVLTLLWIEAPKDMTSPQVSGLKWRSRLKGTARWPGPTIGSRDIDPWYNVPKVVLNAERLYGPSTCVLELDQRLCREWLCEVGDAPGL